MQRLKPIDLTKLLSPFENGWVALSMDYKKVLSHGKTLEEADKLAKKTGQQYQFYQIIPKNFHFMIPHFRVT